MSYTVSDLQVERQYYLRVAAVNLVGARPIPQPLKATPTLQRPGKPSSVVVDADVACGAAPCLQVRWNFPRVPFHGLFCGGGGTAAPTTPADCPVRMGRSVEADFGSGEPFTLDINGLTAGLTYYVRVAAVNSQGIGRYQAQAGLIGDGDVLTGVPSS